MTNHYIEKLEKQIVRIRLTEYITDEIGEAFLTELEPYLAAASSEEPLLVLTSKDTTARTSPNVRRQFVNVAQNPHLGAVAITESNPFIKVLATFVMKAARRSEIVRFFKTEEEALQWLKEQRK